LDKEVGGLRGLELEELQARWPTAFRRRAPPHLPRHLLFHILAYRLQADRLGELDADSRRLLDRIGAGPSDETDWLAADLNRARAELEPGTLLMRERGGHFRQGLGVGGGVFLYRTNLPHLAPAAFAKS